MSCADALQRMLREAEAGSDGGDGREILARIDSYLQHATMTTTQRPVMPGLTEYQSLEIEDARSKGLLVHDVEISFHPLCGEKGVAALMAAQQLNAAGNIIRSFPDLAGNAIDQADGISLVYSTSLSREEVLKTASIPGITGAIIVKEHEAPGSAGFSKKTVVVDHAPGEGGATSGDPGLVQHAEMLRIESSRVDTIMNLVGELIIGRSMIDQVSRDLEEDSSSGDAASRLSTINAYLERTLRELQNGVMKMRMVPVNTVFRKFPKVVRDLSREKGKRVRIEILGKEAELDKSIVDALGEPLSHIVRNMIDHGIEAPADRVALGKPEEGTITLRAFHEAAHIVIEASDDGQGIDTGKLKKKAMAMDLLTADEAVRLTDAEAVHLMFHAGLSTADRVSETSGRGVGMDVVRSAVAAMKGSIEINSRPGKGATFTLTLPLTLAVIKALLFEVGDRVFAVPVAAVAEVLRVMPDDLTTVDSKDTLLLRDQIVSLVRLRELFGIDGKSNEKQFALLIGSGTRKMGLLVDRLVGQQELVIKAVDERQARSGLVAGASILGDGKVVLILDAAAVFRKAVTREKERALHT